MSGQRFATRWTDFLCTESLDRQGYLDYAFCLCDTSEKGRGGPRTATGVIALLGVMDTHRANTQLARGWGVGGGGTWAPWHSEQEMRPALQGLRAGDRTPVRRPGSPLASGTVATGCPTEPASFSQQPVQTSFLRPPVGPQNPNSTFHPWFVRDVSTLGFLGANASLSPGSWVRGDPEPGQRGRVIGTA